MSKRREKRTQRQLVAELIQFMRTGKRKSISVEDYFQLTDKRKHWTSEHKNLLYRGLQRSKAVTVSKSQNEKCLTVRDIESASVREITVSYTRMEVALLS